MRTIIPGVEERHLAEAARRLRAARHPAALTGAGISVASGIPDFRSPGGLWSIFPPEEYATLGAFRRDPGKAWRLYRTLGETLRGKHPNPAHTALARLEAVGRLRLIVTQNIDGLHQAAGSQAVIEIHGDHGRLQCVECGHLEAVREERIAGTTVPRCPSCGAALKPNVVLFGEPVRGLERIEPALERCDLLLVAGTSALVHPAAALPALVHARGGLVLEFNLEETALSWSGVTDFLFLGPASVTLPLLVDAVLREDPPPGDRGA